MPVGFSSEGIVIELLAFRSPVLFPVRVIEILLCDLKALRHFILGLFGGAIVVVSDTIHRLVDRPHLPLLLKSNRVLHLIDYVFNTLIK